MAYAFNDDRSKVEVIPKSDIEQDYVQFTDTMTASKAGVAKIGSGLEVSNGALQLNGGDMGGAVADWLDDHPEATTTVQDNSLTNAKLIQTGGILEEVIDIRTGYDGNVWGAAAEAVKEQYKNLSYATGILSRLANNTWLELTQDYFSQRGIDINGHFGPTNTTRISTTGLIPVAKGNRVYVSPGIEAHECFAIAYNKDRVAQSNSGWFDSDRTFLFAYDGYLSLAFAKPGRTDDISVSDYDATVRVLPKNTLDPRSQLITGWCDTNDMVDSGRYVLTSNTHFLHAPDDDESLPRYMDVIAFDDNSIHQLYYKPNGTMYMRTKISGVWQDWNPVGRVYAPIKSGIDIDTIIVPGTYAFQSSISSLHEANPSDTSKPRYLEVIALDDNSVKQIMYYANPERIYTRIKLSGTWQDWSIIGESKMNNNHLFDLFTPACSTRYIFGKGKRWEYLLNTVESFEAAGQDPRCWGMTGDIQYTSDGEIVMFHDAKVEYNGIMQNINDLTYAQIQTITLTDGTNTYSIPTCEDYIKICRKYGKVPIFETKAKTVGASWIANGHQADLEKVVNMIKNYGLLDRCMWLGYGDDMTYLKLNYPHQIGLIYTYDQYIRSWDSLREDLLKDNYNIHAGYPETLTWTTGFNDTVMAEIHAAGSYAIGYTPSENAQSYIQAMINLNYDAIILYAEPPAQL